MQPRGTLRHHIPDSIVAHILRKRQRTADLARRASTQILNLEIADKNKARAEHHYFREGKQPESVMMKPLHKTVSGSGYDLAKRLIPDINNTNRDQPPKPEAAFGAFPTQFRPILNEYRLVDIFDLIEFYNESFRIVRGDTREDMIRKIFGFFTTCSYVK